LNRLQTGQTGDSMFLLQRRLVLQVTVGVAIVVVVAGCCLLAPKPQELPIDVAKRIAQLNEDKQRAANAARRLIKAKAKFPDKYQKGAVLYEEARSAWNSWIDTVVFSINSEQPLNDDDLRTRAEGASNNAKKFVSYAGGITGLGITETLIPIVGAMWEIGKRILDYRGKLAQQQKELLVAQLRSLAWPTDLDGMAKVAAK